MAVFAILDATNSDCPHCGENDDGMIFCPALQNSSTYTFQKMATKFLCDDCFESFIQSGDHETVLINA